jgi:hypothetical protein
MLTPYTALLVLYLLIFAIRILSGVHADARLALITSALFTNASSRADLTDGINVHERTPKLLNAVFDFWSFMSSNLDMCDTPYFRIVVFSRAVIVFSLLAGSDSRSVANFDSRLLCSSFAHARHRESILSHLISTGATLHILHIGWVPVMYFI